MITIIEMLVILIPAAVKDLRQKEIPLLHVIFTSGIGVLINLWMGKETLVQILCGFLVGALFLLIAIFSKEKLGVGDGVLILFTGGVLGISSLVPILIFSFLASGIFGMVRVFVKKRGVDEKMPFAPFYAGVVFIWVSLNLWT